jgi:hypothetical protein
MLFCQKLLKSSIMLNDRLHLRLDTIERLLENKNPTESNSKSPKKEGPTNHGARWTPEQDEWMLNAIAKNISFKISNVF